MAEINVKKLLYDLYDSIVDSNKTKILVIGDAIVSSYAGYIGMKLDDKFNVRQLATSRSINHNVYWQLVEEELCRNNYAVICFNFSLHGYLNLEDFEKGMDKYANILKKTNAKIIYIGTTPVNTFKRIYKEVNNLICDKNKIAERICKKYNFDYFDLYNFLVNKKGLHKGKNDVYFNKKGNEIIGNAIANKIVEVYNSSKGE